MHDRSNKSTSIYGTLVKRINENTKLRGITPLNLASASDIASERLTSILNGHSREVTLRELVGLSIALDISLSALLSES